MKLIVPITVWKNGDEIEVGVLDAMAASVKLDHSAEFIFHLYTINEDQSLGEMANQGRITMDGQDYIDWDQDSFAWDWVANKLKLTITGEYIPPAPKDPSAKS